MCFTNLIIHLAQVLLSLVIPYLKILVGVKLVNTSGYDGMRETNEGPSNGFHGLDGLFRDSNDMGPIVCSTNCLLIRP